MAEPDTSDGLRYRRSALHGLLFVAASVLPLWVAALDPRILASSYGSRFVAFELMGFTFATALAIAAAWELRLRGPLSWRAVLPVALPVLVTLDATTYLSELARKPFDYDCYEYAGRALLLGEDPYRVGLNYLYPPLLAQLFAAAARGAGRVAQLAGFAPTEDGVWDAVFYLYQCAQIGLVAALYFLGCRLARAFGLERPWGPLLVAALLLFDNPLLRTLRHGQINLWVLDLSLVALLAARRRPWLAGLALSAAIHLKLYPIVLLLPLLANGAWRAMLWTGVGALAIFGLQTDAFRDLTPWRQFATFMAGTYPGEFAFRNASFHSLAVNALRFFAGVAPRAYQSEVRMAATAFSLLMVGWLLLRVGLRHVREASPSRLLSDGSDALAFSLLISQSVWEHHYVFALPLMIRAVALRGREQTLRVALAGFLALWMPTFDLFPLSYHRAVGLLLLLSLTRPQPGRQARGDATPAPGAR